MDPCFFRHGAEMFVTAVANLGCIVLRHEGDIEVIGTPLAYRYCGNRPFASASGGEIGIPIGNDRISLSSPFPVLHGPEEFVPTSFRSPFNPVIPSIS